MKRILIPAIGLAALTGLKTYGQSADAIIDKLVDKGILTVKEANELREESDKNFDSAYSVKTGMPEWVNSFKITGDVRGRLETFHAEDPFVDRTRLRYRLRAGAVAVLRDNLEVGFRLTSSESQGSFGGDPISGNTSFQDNGSKKFIFVDLAYGKWRPIDTALWSGTLVVGKMENPFVFSDMVFDGDYTPEGLAQQFAFNVNDNHKMKLNFGEFMLDEIGASTHDPFMLGAQLRLDSKWNEKISSSAGISGLTITSEDRLRETAATGTTPASSSVPNVNRGNTRENGVLANNFNPVIVDGAVTYNLEKFWFYNAAFPIRLGAEYMNNPAVDSENEGYSVGITFGKSGKRGLWDVSYRWKHLEADAWYEEVVDSDFGALNGASYGSGTNVEGHIFKASYSPFNSMTLGMTYFLTKMIEGDDETVGRLQVDAIWKF